MITGCGSKSQTCSFKLTIPIFLDVTFLAATDDIYAPWGIGTPDVWYLKQISIIIFSYIKVFLDFNRSFNGNSCRIFYIKNIY